MFNNPISTIPQVADMLRVKGAPPKSLPVFYGKGLDEEKVNPDNTDFWEKWMSDERSAVYNKVKNFNTAQKRLLLDKTQPTKSNNKGAEPFPVTSSFNNLFNNSPLSGKGFGTANISQVAGLSDMKLNEWRNMLIENRMKEYGQIGQASFRPVDNTPREQRQDEKLKDDLALVGVEERIFAEIADSSTYNALNNVISYYAQNIYKYDDTNYFVNLLARLNELRNEAVRLFQIYKEEEFTGYGELSSNIDYAEVILEALNRFIQFIQANMEFVGNTESERYARQQSTQRMLTKKSSMVGPTLDLEIENFIQKYNLTQYSLEELHEFLDEERIQYDFKQTRQNIMKAVANHFIKNPDLIENYFEVGEDYQEPYQPLLPEDEE